VIRSSLDRYLFVSYYTFVHLSQIYYTYSCKFEAFMIKIPIEYLASLHYLSWLDRYEFELITWNLLSFLIKIIANQSNSFWKLTVKQRKGREDIPFGLQIFFFRAGASYGIIRTPPTEFLVVNLHVEICPRIIYVW
jgi:hypothetical protein